MQRGGLSGARRGGHHGRRGSSRRARQDRAGLQETDYVLLPLAQYPKSGIWRADKVAGPVGDEVVNARAFDNFSQWEDVDGDGQIVIGAEQWPACLNPVTECANSSWSMWTVVYPVLPAIWDTTAEGTFEPTELVVGEPTVETAG